MPLRYKLDDLGWFFFESLCQSILTNKFAVGIQAWGGSGDYGRDAYYVGALPIPDETDGTRSQRFVFQAKFVENANAAGAMPRAPLRKAVSAEIARIKLRAAPPECYVLMTNAPLSSALRLEVEDALRTAMPNTTVVTWGERELSGLLDGLRDVRLSFPQILSQPDLLELVRTALNGVTHERSVAMLARGAEDAPAFVRTSVYASAYNTLATNHMAVLTGPPEMGKTTIAYAIAFERAANGWDTFAVRTAAELLLHHKRDRLQLFVADDAFGSTEYQPGLAEAWAPDFDEVFRRLDDRHWIIWTSRTAPLEAALRKMHLQGRAEHFPDPGRIFVNATSLTVREKALMLYSHAKASQLSAAARDLVRTHAESIVKHPFFTPKRVQRFVTERMKATPTVMGLRGMIDDEMRAPTKAMRHSFDALQAEQKAFLVSALDGPFLDKAFERHRPTGCGASAAEVEPLLRGHFVLRREPLDRMWGEFATGRTQKSVAWTHPSWRDLLIDYVAESDSRRQAFLSNCGVAGFELALSTGGGTSGERQRPFLRSARDWEVLGGRIESMVSEIDEDEDEVRDLLAVLQSVFEKADPVGDEEEYFNRWGATALDALRCRWDRRGAEILVRQLKQYYEVAEWVRPLRPSPDLRRTWESSVEEARHETKSPNWYTEFSAVKEWLELTKLLQANEPRFLRQVGFPDSYSGLVEQLLGECEEYLSGEPLFSFREEYEVENEQLETIETVGRQIGAVFTDLEQRAYELARNARERIDEYEETLRNDDLPSRRPGDPRPVPPEHPPAPADIDIGRLFADL